MRPAHRPMWRARLKAAKERKCSLAHALDTFYVIFFAFYSLFLPIIIHLEI